MSARTTVHLGRLGRYSLAGVRCPHCKSGQVVRFRIERRCIQCGFVAWDGDGAPSEETAPLRTASPFGAFLHTR